MKGGGMSNWLRGMAWTSPWWLGFLLFLAGPMVISAYISFCDYPLLQSPIWVGTDNYTNLMHDDVFHKVVGNTFTYAFWAIPIGTVVAILLAALLNQKVKGQGIFRTCIFVPSVVPLVAAAVVWLWLLNPQYGLVNDMLRTIGIENPPKWFGDPSWVMASLVLVGLWGVGSPVVIYLAGLQEIPESLYEAARLDGASRFRQFWHVTLPGLSPVILFNVIIGIIATWQIFALPYVMMKGGTGPEKSAYFYTMYLYDNAFRYLKMGYASAMAWIQFGIILALTGIVFWISRKMVHYRNE